MTGDLSLWNGRIMYCICWTRENSHRNRNIWHAQTIKKQPKPSGPWLWGAPAIGITAAYAMVLALLAFTARGLSGESSAMPSTRQVRYWSRPDPRQSICPGLSGRWKRHLIPQRTINAVKP